MKAKFRIFCRAKINIISSLFLMIFALSCQAVQAQIEVTETKSPASVSLNRERGLRMLSDIKEIVKERYYDPSYHGINLDEHFKSAAETIKNQTPTGRFSGRLPKLF